MAAVVTLFYPRNLDSLLPSPISSWNLLTNPHGLLPSFIGITTMTIVGWLGVHINEFWWNLPFVLLNLLPIFLAPILLARISTPQAGVMAAFLLAILPIHTALSRTCGISNALALNCHFITVLLFMRYFEDPTPRHARWASIALAINLTVEMLFPVLLVLVFCIGILTVQTSKPMLMMRIQRTRTLMFSPRVMLLPLAVITFNFILLIAYIAGWASYGGLAARLLEGSNRQPGVQLQDFWDNACFAMGNLAFPIMLCIGLFGLPTLWRLQKQAIPLLWAIVYLAPFIVFTREHVYAYYLFGAAPLTMHATMMLYTWWQKLGAKRIFSGIAVCLLVVLFFLRTLSITYGIDYAPIASLVGTGKSSGAVFPDQGLKAAAWWVRTHTDSDTLVFGDSTLEQYQLWYYLHRPSVGVTDAETPEDAYMLLEDVSKQPAMYLVEPEHVAYLEQYAQPMPTLLATVVVQHEEALLIYGYEEQVYPEVLEAQHANQRFDEDFGDWRSMFLVGTRK